MISFSHDKLPFPHVATALSESKRTFYACGEYDFHRLHCDPTLNRMEGYQLNGSSTLVYSIGNDRTFTTSKQGKGLELYASHKEAVRFTNVTGADLPHFSASFWIKRVPQSEVLYGHILSVASPYNKSGWFFDMKNVSSPDSGITQVVSFNIYNSIGELFTAGSVAIPPDTFSHIAGTFDGSSLRLYKDRILSGVTEFHGNYTGNPSVPLTIGMQADCSCNNWSGIIDELSLYNRTLMDTEIPGIFDNASNNSDSNALIGYWKFDGNLDDSSGNKNEGTINSPLGSMAFSPDGRLFFDELNTGKIRIMKEHKIVSLPFAKLSDYHLNWEQGLLGLTIDPRFEENHFVYLYYTAIDNKTGKEDVFNKVVRFTDHKDVGTEMLVLLDRIPATKLGFHAGGALAFGPDDKLYVTVGDAYNDISAQDTAALTGKVLRINRDGSVPDDNPFTTSPASLTSISIPGLLDYSKSFLCNLVCHTPVYNIGHRNMFGLAFDKNGFGIVTEPGGFSYDEINSIEKGGNYGWPTLQPTNLPPEISNNSSIKPLRSYWNNIAPIQVIYYDGEKIPELKGKFLFGTYTGDIYAVKIDKSTGQIVLEEKIDVVYPKVPIAVPIISLAQSPDGNLYYGAYNIYELNHVNSGDKKQSIFPIEFNSTGIAVKSVQIDKVGTKVTIDIHHYSNRDPYASLYVKIPKQLLNGIFQVLGNSTKVHTNQTAMIISSDIDSSNAAYTLLDIHLNSGEDLTLSIVGKKILSEDIIPDTLRS